MTQSHRSGSAPVQPRGVLEKIREIVDKAPTRESSGLERGLALAQIGTLASIALSEQKETGSEDTMADDMELVECEIYGEKHKMPRVVVDYIAALRDQMLSADPERHRVALDLLAKAMPYVRAFGASGSAPVVVDRRALDEESDALLAAYERFRASEADDA